jgi:hypothetical protein
MNLVNRVFDLPGLYSSTEVLLAIYGYAVQIWADFSGYTDIAIGSALVLGIALKENFDRPCHRQTHRVLAAGTPPPRGCATAVLLAARKPPRLKLPSTS